MLVEHCNLKISYSARKFSIKETGIYTVTGLDIFIVVRISTSITKKQLLSKTTRPGFFK